MESHGLRTAVIATSISGIPELVQEGETGTGPPAITGASRRLAII